MLRRVHVPAVYPGHLSLDDGQARHVRDVLRLAAGATVEVFDDAGHTATGELILTGNAVAVAVTEVVDAVAQQAVQLTIAAAVPKGERADWMVEKLCELGTAAFIPLAAARSVVLPEGKNKRERWVRIATEAAKQSRRAGVMRIGELTSVAEVLKAMRAEPGRVGWYFATSGDSRSIQDVLATTEAGRAVTALIGPEGGWTDAETASFESAGLAPVRLTDTVLRVETAAVAAAAVVGSWRPPARRL